MRKDGREMGTTGNVDMGRVSEALADLRRRIYGVSPGAVVSTVEAIDALIDAKLAAAKPTADRPQEPAKAPKAPPTYDHVAELHFRDGLVLVTDEYPPCESVILRKFGDGRSVRLARVNFKPEGAGRLTAEGWRKCPLCVYVEIVDGPKSGG